MEIKRSAADGDLVWLHLHTKRTPEVRGNAVINIFRMKDGKFVEHWNVGPLQRSQQTIIQCFNDE